MLAAIAAGLMFPLSPASAAPAAAVAGASERLDPFDAAASVPTLRYRSAFSGYRPLSTDTRGWKAANDEVGRIGGWRAYAREAQAPQAGESAARTVAPDGQDGDGAHGSHGGGHGADGGGHADGAKGSTGPAGRNGGARHGAPGAGQTK